jgi:hypothetical protein
VDLRDVVRASCDDLRSLFEPGRLDLRLELPPGPIWVDADATRMAQVVGNLLQNAQFTSEADFVSTGGLTGEGGATTEPDGPEEIDRMLSRAGERSSRGRTAAWPGLALVRGFQQPHGGTVRAHSAGLGEGAEFVVSLPIASEAGAVAGDVPCAAPEHRRVLIIEDNVDAGSLRSCSSSPAIASRSHTTAGPASRSPASSSRTSFSATSACPT